MTLSIDLIPGFTYKDSVDYHYSVEKHKNNVFSIWLNYHRIFDYNLGKQVSCIWGFFDVKKNQFYAPINSKTPGKPVDFENTTQHTSMQIKITPLEAAFR